MIAADHSQCQKKHDKLLPYNSWLAGWLDGLFTQDTEYSKVKVMIPFFLPACLPCLPACKHIQGGGAHHQTHHCAHDEDHHASAPEDDAGIFDCSGGGARRSKL
jgi:hypothetical protein